MNTRAIADTGFLVALFHEGDKHHSQALIVEQNLGDACQFVSTVFVLQETCWILSSRAKNGHNAVIAFMENVSKGLLSFPELPEDWLDKATNVLRKYSNRDLDLADASLVVLADHINLGTILSVDFKDFSILKWDNGKKNFKNLMNDDFCK